MVVDVRRHFRDPHRDEALCGLTAEDAAVAAAVLATPGVPDLIASVTAVVRAFLAGPSPNRFTAAIGCAGGRHRSATIAIEIADRLVGQGVKVAVTHRDIGKPVHPGGRD